MDKFSISAKVDNDIQGQITYQREFSLIEDYFVLQQVFGYLSITKFAYDMTTVLHWHVQCPQRDINSDIVSMPWRHHV